MYLTECLICNEQFSHSKREWATRRLTNHVKKEHEIDYKEYVIKYYYDGIEPTCACGCNAKVKFDRAAFNKYVADHAKHKVVTKESRRKISETLLKNNERNYLKIGLTPEKLLEYLDLYKKPNYPAEKIAEISGHDFRTIAGWWIKLEFIGVKTLNKYKYLHKYVYGRLGKKNKSYQEIDLEILDKISDYLSYLQFKNKSTNYVHLIKMFDLDCSEYVLKKRLQDHYPDQFNSTLNNFNSSKIELEFISILKYFIGPRNVIQQFFLEGKKFDCCIYGKYLIEVDGLYWHGKKEGLRTDLKIQAENNDKEKDKIANENGFEILRITDVECKDVSKVFDIIKYLLENKNEN